MKTNTYKDLFVWQKSYELVKEIYFVTKSFPKDEQYGIISQMRRAAIAIPSNIAEGYGRNSRKDYSRFCSIAYGSLLELETQLNLSIDLKFTTTTSVLRANQLIVEVTKMLYVLINKLNA